MKKILFFLLALASSQFLFAQAPQGINYQAVAMTASNPIASQNVSLRLSIIDSAASGSIIYTETHHTTTDAVGLFSVVIGNGTAVVGTFSNINWGKHYKWLKSEIDVLDGSNYVLMGITQFMSVPYALYANSSKNDFKSIQVPDGLLNANSVIIDVNNYTVPVGKILYVTPFANTLILGSGDTIANPSDGIKYLCFKEGTVIRTLKRSWQNYTDTIIAFTVNKSVDWIFQNIVTNPLVVPNGKSFIIISALGNSNYFAGGNKPKISLNGIPYFFFDTLHGNVITSGNTLSGIG
ncbi:MAG: hypothetical protein RL065_350, partial [Bacteroidota bacterium]